MQQVKNTTLLILTLFIMQLGLSTRSSAAPVNEIDNVNATLARGLYGQGAISSADDNDRFVINSLNTGDRLFALLHTPNTLDPVLSARDAGNNIIFYNDDGGPPAAAFDDSLFDGLVIQRNGALVLQADGFGSSTGTFELHQIVLGPNEDLPEVEPNNSPETAMPIRSASILANGASDDDFFSFSANVGEHIVVFADLDPVDRDDQEIDPDPPPTPTPGGTPQPASSSNVPKTFSARIDVFSTDGATNLTEPDLENETTKYATGKAVGVIIAPNTGKYFVRIRRIGNTNAHPYRLIVLVDGDSPVQGACCSFGSCTIKSALNCIGRFAGAGSTCEGDRDADGVPNDCDNCADVANPIQDDADGEDVGDVCDACAQDFLKISPGQCGCGVREIDSDADGTADCNDLCEFDPLRSAPGACGCGSPAPDANGNGVPDCENGAEARAQLQSLLSLVRSFKALPGGASPAKKKAQAAKVKQIQKLNGSLRSLLQGSLAGVSVNLPGFDLNRTAGTLSRTVTAMLRAKGKVLSRKKQSAVELAENLVNVIS